MTTSAVNQMDGSGPDSISGGEKVCLVMMPFKKIFDPVIDAIRVGVDRALRAYRDRAAELEAQNKEYRAETNKLTAERDKYMYDAAKLTSQNRTLSNALLRRPTAEGLGAQVLKAWIVGNLKASMWKGQFQYVDGRKSAPVQQSLEFSGSSW